MSSASIQEGLWEDSWAENRGTETTKVSAGLTGALELEGLSELLHIEATHQVFTVPIPWLAMGYRLTWGTECWARQLSAAEDQSQRASTGRGWPPALSRVGGDKGFRPKGGGRGSFRRTRQRSSDFLLYSHQWKPLRLALDFKAHATFSSFVTGCHLVSKNMVDKSHFKDQGESNIFGNPWAKISCLWTFLSFCQLFW